MRSQHLASTEDASNYGVRGSVGRTGTKREPKGDQMSKKEVVPLPSQPSHPWRVARCYLQSIKSLLKGKNNSQIKRAVSSCSSEYSLFSFISCTGLCHRGKETEITQIASVSFTSFCAIPVAVCRWFAFFSSFSHVIRSIV